MKKFSSKFIASAVMAVIAASAMAISSSAAIDYYDNPQYHVPEYTGNASGATTGGSTAGSTDTGSQTDDDTTDETDTSESTVGSVVSESAVEDAIESGDPILVTAENGSATIQETAIGAIANSDSPVSFVVSDDASGFDYVVTIDPDSIKEVKAINIAVNLNVGSFSGVNGVVIRPAQSGDFGMTLAITIPAAAVKDLDEIKLFYISDDNQITDVTDALTVNGDGSGTIAISHAASCFITDIELVALSRVSETDIDIDDDDDDDDDTDVVIDEPEQGKDDTTVVNPGSTAGTDSNPVTGTTLALGSLAVFAAAAVATSKKRK